MESQYGVIEPQAEFPVKRLLRVHHKDSDLVVGFPAFGPRSLKENLEEMSEDYSHPTTGEKISFRKPTTSESISAIAYGFGSNKKVDAKRDILNPIWLQAGDIIRTQDGVFTNTTETDESKLKAMLNNAEKVKGIYFLPNEVAFAPYDTFDRGVQDCDTFVQGGLARALEHTYEKVAQNLKVISSPQNYRDGVGVYDFGSVKEPVSKVVTLSSFRGFALDWLFVDGDGWVVSDGSAFGVLSQEK
ncbi:hypothetical protein COU59_01250 [Candidatus Pacearchaeota archaeon CG10_big_fil_rev_8_21_14_0_10_34_12]|nr:MAG: hypothetical protein COU59_01250 [Candidatus Pacearchaeota archaeon CG10_big_fil_rev_8_21_14_0_10_34_12]